MTNVTATQLSSTTPPAVPPRDTVTPQHIVGSAAQTSDTTAPLRDIGPSRYVLDY